MAPIKAKKGIWTKLTKLSEEDLQQKGIEVKPIKTEESKKEPAKEVLKERWLPDTYEGKLNLDIYQNGNNLVVKSTLAGVEPESLEIMIEKDILTIRGERKNNEIVEKRNYFHQECFWGKFSRTVILPTEIKTEEVEANLRNGILTIILPRKEEGKEEKIIKIKR